MPLDLSDRQFALGDWTIDPKVGRIFREGAEVRLEPRVMTVLTVLAAHEGGVVSRELLEEAAWPGMVVGYDALTNSINKLRKALQDDSRHPKYIETVSKKGYRLVADVQLLHATQNPNISRPVSNRRIAALAIFSAILILSLFSSFILKNKPANKTVELTSIVVLPFTNLGGDTEQDYFSDGITADLITDLSKLSQLFVIARNSAFTYKGRFVNVREVGQELGVRYVLQGSVRRSGEQIRITAQLTDAENGFNLWAERFDGTKQDVFALQDTVNQKIVRALKLKIANNNRANTRQTNSVEAYDYFLKGWQYFWRFNKADNQQAREFYRSAIEQDAHFARAFANLSLTHAYDIFNGWSEDVKRSREQAYFYARKAVELDANLPQVHWSLGTIDLFSQQYDLAIKSAQRVIELSPNSADGYGLLAATLNFSGKPEAAESNMQKAMRLNPLHPFIYLIIMGEIQFNLKNYAQAEKNFIRATQRNPVAQEARLWLVASLAYQDKMEEAAWQLTELKQLNPDLSGRILRGLIPFKVKSQQQHFIRGLQKAGLQIDEIKI